MIKIYEIKDRMDLFDQAVDFFWKQWGSTENVRFYHDCMKHSCNAKSELPRFYLALQNDQLIGSYALLTNDLISRQDLTPWLACLYVIPELRGKGFGSLLLQHAAKEANKKGFENFYLCTDLEGYYEKYGWSYMAEAYIFNGQPTKVYVKTTAS
ncbi:GNAT family N-acetyltransferase [Neobacillus muris]|uniref:GNAT family N-acetyltransferase n=1 Tax=Neobacillus muris TaxID=2941334 RepID=UPI00203E9E4D|nr:GNAT family N-acetyltransferase [Neobacillus muris]